MKKGAGCALSFCVGDYSQGGLSRCFSPNKTADSIGSSFLLASVKFIKVHKLSPWLVAIDQIPHQAVDGVLATVDSHLDVSIAIDSTDPFPSLVRMHFARACPLSETRTRVIVDHIFKVVQGDVAPTLLLHGLYAPRYSRGGVSKYRQSHHIYKSARVVITFSLLQKGKS